MLPGMVFGQDEGKERKTKETVAMSQAVYEQLAAIQELIVITSYSIHYTKLYDQEQLDVLARRGVVQAVQHFRGK